MEESMEIEEDERLNFELTAKFVVYTGALLALGIGAETLKEGIDIINGEMT